MAGKGGARENTGPTPNWLKDECRAVLKKQGLIKFLADVAEGSPVKKVFDISGKQTEAKVSADIRDRLKAIEMLMDRGFGRAIQPTVDETPEENRRRIVLVYPTTKQLIDTTLESNGNGNGH